MTPAPEREAICAFCSTSIGPGHNVYVEQGHAIHLRCRLDLPETTRAVADFLKRQGDTRFCPVCVAVSASVSVAEARDAMERLGLGLGLVYRVEVGGRCSICRQERITVRAEVPRKAA